MAEPTASHPTTPTVEVASLVRRALLVSAGELVDALATSQAVERRRQRALDRWFAGYADQVRRYHELLDSMVVPALAARGALDQRTLDTIAADHAWIDQLLSDVGDALGILSFGLGAEAWWLGKASDLAASLQHVLAGQLSREERLLRPLIARWPDADEHEVLQREAMRAVATGPLGVSLAWFSTHLDDAERAAVASYVPATSRLAWRVRRMSATRAAVAAIG
jgi:hypothetical protein